MWAPAVHLASDLPRACPDSAPPARAGLGGRRGAADRRLQQAGAPGAVQGWSAHPQNPPSPQMPIRALAQRGCMLRHCRLWPASPKTLARVPDCHLRPRPRRISAPAARGGASQDAAAAGGPPGARTLLPALSPAGGRARTHAERRAPSLCLRYDTMVLLRVNSVPHIVARYKLLDLKTKNHWPRQVGALRDIKRDMAARRASLHKLVVTEAEARIFCIAEPNGGAGGAAAAGGAQRPARGASPAPPCPEPSSPAWRSERCNACTRKLPGQQDRQILGLQDREPLGRQKHVWSWNFGGRAWRSCQKPHTASGPRSWPAAAMRSRLHTAVTEAVLRPGAVPQARARRLRAHSRPAAAC